MIDEKICIKVLEEKHSISILLYLRSNDGCIKSDLYRNISTNPRMPEKLNSLETANLINQSVDKFNHNATTITLTSFGKTVAEELYQITDLFSTKEGL